MYQDELKSYPYVFVKIILVQTEILTTLYLDRY